MNKFDESFFKKYLPEESEIIYVVHKHTISILWKIFLFISLFVLIPTTFYYLSYKLKDIIPFYFFELYLLITFAKVIYDIFDWYIDSWIITNDWIYDIKWKLFKTDVNSVNYENIEWIEIEQDWIIDKVFKKWNLIIHKVGSDTFRLNDVSNPYFAAEQIEENSEWHDEHEHEEDKFELMMETLSWVVADYLERKWHHIGSHKTNHHDSHSSHGWHSQKNSHHNSYQSHHESEHEEKEDYVDELAHKEGTIDLR